AAGRRVAEPSDDPYAVLLPIRSDGLRPPLFCVHPASGLSWCYSHLLRHIDTARPIYGVQARGFHDGDRLPDSVGEMVADYLAEIRRVQPEGPYHLVGWSFGGEVAYALATALRSAGEAVDLLCLIDTGPVA